MKLFVEVEIQDGMVKILDRVAKKLCIRDGTRGLLRQELEDKLREIEVWLERFTQ